MDRRASAAREDSPSPLFRQNMCGYTENGPAERVLSTANTREQTKKDEKEYLTVQPSQREVREAISPLKRKRERRKKAKNTRKEEMIEMSKCENTSLNSKVWNFR